MTTSQQLRNLTAAGIALCKCGVDMVDHPRLEPWGDYPTETLNDEEHDFDAAGTKHRCEEWLPSLGAFCPRPRYHQNEAVECGPLTGEKLW
jgi:hypothetical protein